MMTGLLGLVLAVSVLDVFSGDDDHDGGADHDAQDGAQDHSNGGGEAGPDTDATHDESGRGGDMPAHHTTEMRPPSGSDDRWPDEGTHGGGSAPSDWSGDQTAPAEETYLDPEEEAAFLTEIDPEGPGAEEPDAYEQDGGQDGQIADEGANDWFAWADSLPELSMGAAPDQDHPPEEAEAPSAGGPAPQDDAMPEMPPVSAPESVSADGAAGSDGPDAHAGETGAGDAPAPTAPADDHAETTATADDGPTEGSGADPAEPSMEEAHNGMPSETDPVTELAAIPAHVDPASGTGGPEPVATDLAETGRDEMLSDPQDLDLHPDADLPPDPQDLSAGPGETEPVARDHGGGHDPDKSQPNETHDDRQDDPGWLDREGERGDHGDEDRDRGGNDHRRDDHDRGDHGKGDHGKGDHGKEDHGKPDREPNEHGGHGNAHGIDKTDGPFAPGGPATLLSGTGPLADASISQTNATDSGNGAGTGTGTGTGKGASGKGVK